MYGCESWTIKKGECRRINVFELWCWRRLLRVPWTARRSSQSILKINPEYSLEGLMLKQTPILWSPDVKSWLIRKDPDLGKIEGRRRWGQQRMRWLNGITYSNGHEFEQASRVADGQGGLVCCSPWGHQELDMTEWLNNNTVIQGLENREHGDFFWGLNQGALILPRKTLDPRTLNTTFTRILTLQVFPWDKKVQIVDKIVVVY